MSWDVECPYCPTHEQPRQNKRLRKQAIIREVNSSIKFTWAHWGSDEMPPSRFIIGLREFVEVPKIAKTQ